ncbi:3'-5' exonuclease [Mucilaginibacter sp. FT3.2]|uniref:3'-5' exonuclease n=1 Tax=Mucilaginibacter sp. FT3.2 TaxID=2723090 RepID=UPI001616EF6D|nr:3'-5' exonuclease [Mucilaginibacter sp. FT3.2]MBB6229976.1 DNA polymerase-3 subunit epsilon [Mucilaginibacter sp. FT3.2]
MNDYLLFIDTEASGLPLKWNLPYSADENWPHALQVSWLIYDKHHALVKQQDHYINAEGINITPAALDIHGLTPEFLAANGRPPAEIMQLLVADVLQYQPMLIGHFIRLDYYLLGAAFYRSAMENPLNKLPVFCTMVATTQLVHSSLTRHLRLEELYYMLFNTDLQNQHNALHDAQATATCFFELRNRGEISDKSIRQQNQDFEQQRDPAQKQKGCLLPALMIILLVAIVIIYSL